jgi:hypothetical protein
MKTIIKLLLPMVLILSPIFSTRAQDHKETFNNLRVSYFGKSVTRPGIKVGSCCVLFSFKPHVRSDGSEVPREIILTPNAGFYYHFKNHAGMFINAETGFRIIYPKGFFWQVDAGAGYLRTFLAAPVYQVNGLGEAHQIVLAGNNQFMPSAGFTLGKCYREQDKKIRSLFGRIGGFLQYPFNTMWLPSITLEIGTSFRI